MSPRARQRALLRAPRADRRAGVPDRPRRAARVDGASRPGRRASRRPSRTPAATTGWSACRTSSAPPSGRPRPGPGAHGADPVRARRAPRLGAGGPRDARGAARAACSTRTARASCSARLAPAARARLVSVGYDEAPAARRRGSRRFCAAAGHRARLPPLRRAGARAPRACRSCTRPTPDFARGRPGRAAARADGRGAISAPARAIAGRVIDLGFVPDAERDAAYAGRARAGEPLAPREPGDGGAGGVARRHARAS